MHNIHHYNGKRFTLLTLSYIIVAVKGHIKLHVIKEGNFPKEI